jgi:hypothetical protein
VRSAVCPSSWCATVRAACSGSKPLVEVQTPQTGRVAYGPVTPEDVPALASPPVSCRAAAHHALCQGPTDADSRSWQRQERLTFARMGLTDPLSLADYQAHAGFDGLRRALQLAPAEVVQQVLDSGLRGRGAPLSRPASSGKPWPAWRPPRNTSCATPTRATPAPTPTA